MFSCENIVRVKGPEKGGNWSDKMEEENDVVIVTNVYGDFCLRKARRKRQKLLVRELFLDYANKTTLHGLPYITRKGVSMIEKIFWLITFIASTCMCLYLISKVWFKWQTSPVIVTVSEQLLPVAMVPFPSVTICPQSKCKSSIYNYTAEEINIDNFFSNENSTYNSTLKEQFARYSDISQVCGVFGSFYSLGDVFPNRHSNASVFEHISEVAPTHDDIFYYCILRGVWVRCKELFSKVVTSEGICYNINSLAADEIFRMENIQQDYQYLYANKPRQGWSMEHGYSDRNDLYPNSSYYPAPGAENGATPDLEVILKDFVHERDHLCNGLNTGFKVYVQHPADLPQSSLYYYAVLNGQVSSMALSFSALNTSETLRHYDAEIRQCFFPDERYLRYFNIYTASNCRLECLSNITFETCGCVAFYMPHNSSDTICSTENELCVLSALDNLLRQESSLATIKCHCLPSCNSVDYEAEILKTEYNLKHYLKMYRKIYNFDGEEGRDHGMNYSKLEMYFKRPSFISMRRSELFGVTDFLANCGGLLGLFLGFSFLSLVEIFYFLTLRLCCTLKKDLEEEKSQTQMDTKSK